MLDLTWCDTQRSAVRRGVRCAPASDRELQGGSMARSSLIGLSVGDLQREIQRRERASRTLRKQHAKLSRQLAVVERKLAAAGVDVGGGRAVSGRRVRPQNKSSLAQALANLLKGKTMSVTEAAVAVKKAGYKTDSPNFRTMVNAQLLNKKLFKRESRGKYTSV